VEGITSGEVTTTTATANEKTLGVKPEEGGAAVTGEGVDPLAAMVDHPLGEGEVPPKKEKKRRSIMGLVDLMKEKGVVSSTNNSSGTATPEEKTPKKPSARHNLVFSQAAPNTPSLPSSSPPHIEGSKTNKTEMANTTGSAAKINSIAMSSAEHTPSKTTKPKEDSKKKNDEVRHIEQLSAGLCLSHPELNLHFQKYSSLFLQFFSPWKSTLKS